MGIHPRSGTCSGSNQSFPSPLPGKARAHRTIVHTGPSTFQIPPPETRINDRNLEKAGYQTLVLYIFFPFLSFFIFSHLPFPLFVNFFFLFFLFPFSPTPTPNSSPHLPPPHSQPAAPDHSPPEARSRRHADSHLRSRPRPAPPPLVHPR